MTKSLPLAVSLLVLVLVLPLMAAARQRKTLSAEPAPAGPWGGFEPIEKITPHIRSLGKFAVDEENKQINTQLVFIDVYGGQFQIVAGTNYKLLIKASDPGAIHNYGATIYEDLKGKPLLKEFNTIPNA